MPLRLPLLTLFACSSGSSETQYDSGVTPSDSEHETGHETGHETESDIQIHSIGPSHVGFFSSVAFHPSRTGEVWASGDDSSGLYNSDDGGDTWTLIDGLPLNQATYSLCFDANLPDRIYAPNHFGRGFLYSGDSGASWQLSQQGLPDTPGEQRRIEAAAVAPGSGDIYVATPSGLYVSTTGGSSFSVVSHRALATAEGFTALAADSDHLVAGSGNGRIYSSADGGTNWTELTSADAGLDVSDLALTSRSVYTGFSLGVVARYDFAGGAAILNDPNSSGIWSGLWTRLEVVEGASLEQDTLWVGLVTNNGVRPVTNIYRSTDGGTTLTPRGNGLDGASIFSIALNPADGAHLVVGTVGEGLFVSRDSGASWTRGSGDLRASAILSFSEDPNDEEHLVANSSESLNGTHGVYETHNGGTTWELVDFQTDARAVEITAGGSLLLARWNAGGVGRRAPTGSWQETLAGESVEEFEHDRADRLWTIGSGLHMSDDDGASWEERDDGTFYAMAQHPTSGDELVICGYEILASTDAFATPGTEIGPQTNDLIASCAFADEDTLLAGTSSGKLFVSENYKSSGTGMTWTELSSPVDVASIRSILTDAGEEGAWYMSAVAPDVDVTDDSTSGILRSRDRGETWQWLDLYPSTLAGQLHPSAHSRRIYAPFWGGAGVLTIDD
jgi:photosystem II stability/assembly factor-like uncharacterized protein